MNRLSLLFIILAFSILSDSCIDCEPRRSLENDLLISFRGADIRFDSIKGLAMEKILFLDTILTDSSYLFPMNRLTDRSTFLFMHTGQNNTLLIDTLTLSYRLRTELIPPNCGLIEYLEDISLDFYSFDSVYVTSPTVRFRDTTNVWVVLKR